LNRLKVTAKFLSWVPLEDGMTPDAASYRNKAAEMRRFAEEARDAISRRQFLDVAAQYDKLARRAEERAATGPQAADRDGSSAPYQL
jgi:hypothetical protein